MSISLPRHVALVGIFVFAGRLDHHCGVHDADRGDVEDRRLALELGVQKLGPRVDGALDEVRPDAERVGVVDGRDEGDPFRRRRREFRRMRALDEHDLLGRGALIANDLAVRQLALGEDRRDIVEFFDLLGVHRQDVAGRHKLLQAEVLGVQNVERVRLRDHALGYVVGGGDDVLDGDPSLFLDLFGHIVRLVDRGAEVSQHLLFLRPDGRKAGDRAGACGGAGEAGRALQYGAAG